MHEAEEVILVSIGLVSGEGWSLFHGVQVP
jgi:hypothetical protein